MINYIEALRAAYQANDREAIEIAYWDVLKAGGFKAALMELDGVRPGVVEEDEDE